MYHFSYCSIFPSIRTFQNRIETKQFEMKGLVANNYENL